MNNNDNDEHEKQAEYGLLVSFPDQSEKFTLGFEAGMVWEKMQKEDEFEMSVHNQNQEVCRRMAAAMAFYVEFNPTSYVEWVDAKFKKKKDFKLKLIKNK
jgi:hypothetical protein